MTPTAAIAAMKAKFKAEWVTGLGALLCDIVWPNGSYTTTVSTVITDVTGQYEPVQGRDYVQFSVIFDNAVEPSMGRDDITVTRYTGAMIIQTRVSLKDTTLGMAYAEKIKSIMSKKTFNTIITYPTQMDLIGRAGKDDRYEIKTSTDFMFEEV